MLQPRTKSLNSSSEEVGLDEFGCLSLADILKCFNAPISEEHAWALIYQSLRALDNSIKDNIIRQPENTYLLHESESIDHVSVETQQHKILDVIRTDDIFIQEDGIIHHNTWCNCSNHSCNRPRSGKNYRLKRRGMSNTCTVSY